MQINLREADGLLIITADNEARSDLKQAFERGGYYAADGCLREYLVNGGLEPLSPDLICALTEMPLFAEWCLDDDGSVTVWGPVYGFPAYMVFDPWERLKNTGRVIFDLMGDCGNAGEHFPEIGSKAYSELSYRNYRDCLK